MLVPLFASTMLTGFLVGKLGYYTPPAIVGDCIAIIGGALLYTLSDASSKAQYAGYQAVYGVGVGMALSSPNMAAQTVLPRDQVAIGISLLFFAQLLAPSILVPAAQTVLTSQLRRRLADIPGLNAGVLSDGGATSIVDVDPAIRGDVIHGYALALRRVFLVGLVIVCVSIFGSATLEWKSTRKAADEKKAAAAQAEEGKMDEKRASTASATEAGDAADRDQPKDTESVAAEGKDQDEKAAPAKK